MNCKEKISNSNYFLLVSLSTLFSFTVFSLVKALKNFNSYESGLTWVGGTQIIPIIETIRGNLKTDFMSNSMLNSPIINTAKLLSLILPKEKINFISSFSTISPIFSGIIYSLTVISLVLFSLSINVNTKENFKKIVFFSSFGLLAFYISNPPLRYILTGHIVGSWYLPISDAFQQTGISYFFAMISIIMPLIAETQILKFNFYKKKFFLISVISHIFSVYLHPVVSLMQVILTFSFGMILKYKNNKYVNFLNLSLLFLFIWIVGILLNLFLYNQTSIDPSAFFRIYVKVRHPHHYLPSHYFDKTAIKILFFNFTILLISIIRNYKKGGFRNLYVRTSITSISLLLAIHITQYFFVENLNISSFTKLGISRMSGSFNFFYMSIIISELCSILQKLKLFNLKINFQNILKFYSLILLTIIILISINLFNISSKSIYKNPSFVLSRYVKKNNLPENAEFIFEKSTNNKFSRLREIGNLNMFFDDHLPFNTGDIIEWENRMYRANELQNCISENEFGCVLKGNYEKDIFLVSQRKIKLNQLDDFIINKERYFIYKVYPYIKET